MSRVLLGHSYFLRFDPKLWRAMQPYPPLGTLYAAACCASAATTSRCSTRCWPSRPTSGRRRCDEERPDVAVLFEDNFNYLSKMCLLRMREAAFAMIARGARRRAAPSSCAART